ncbi:HEAT repeat domain-containing protein [Dactylosporangium sp. CS-033363]|uniref:HEAT repeat domain-containing protein n=1 Tax=Dactylosporangium sp. CS-033363 TaxID=3239935 RepID=UPI003D91CB67
MDVNGLVVRLRSDDSVVRVGARDAIVALGPVAALPAMLAELANPAREAAADVVIGGILGRWGAPAFDPVVRALAAARDEHAARRTSNALYALTGLDSARFAALLRHPSPAVRDAGAYVLLHHGGHDVTAFADDFAPLLGDPDAGVRAKAVRALTEAGPAALPGARRMRRTVPAARRAALLVIAGVDWAALDRDDVDAVRRLVRIKAAREVPAPVSCELESWFAVPSRAAERLERERPGLVDAEIDRAVAVEQAAVLEAFGLSDPEPATMRMGMSAPRDARHAWVTGAIDGWFLVYGMPATPADAMPICADVSAKLGECHYYTSGWLVARDGQVVRWFDPEAYPDDDLPEVGEPLPFEDEWGDPSVGEVLRAISVDPARIGAHTRVRGQGVLALTSSGREHGPGGGVLEI